MESRADGNLRTMLKTVFKFKLDKESDERSGVEKMLDTREFKSWFANHTQLKEAFKKDLALREALVKQVNGPQEALLAKIMMIRQAKYTVDLTYYIYKNDESGYVILNELKEAIRRGVSVRFMFDSMGSFNPAGLTHPEFKALVDFAEKNAGFMKDKYGNITDQKARVEIVSFRSLNPTQLAVGVVRKTMRGLVNSFLKMFGKPELDTIFVNPNHRSHDKILITDQNFPELAVAIVGGRNVGNHYYGIPKVDENTFTDLEVIVKNNPSLVRGQHRNVITTDIGSLYDLLYFHSGNRVVSTNIVSRFMKFKKHYALMDSAAKTVDEITKESQELLGEDFASADFGKRYLTEGFDKGGVDLSYTIDNVMRDTNQSPYEASGKKRRGLNMNHINKELDQYLSSEDKHITIVSPYLWLSPEQVSRIKRWLGSDPERKLTIVTNSIMTSDNMAAQTLVDATLGPQLVLNREYLTAEGETKSYGAEQVELYEYGRLDSKDIGGDKAYGKLHAKGAHMKSLEASFVTTYNADPRSQFLNSELGLFIVSPDHSAKIKSFVDQLIQDSHVWGSDEYHAIRTHPNLGAAKVWIAKNVDTLHKWMVRMRLVWLV
tara:strand:+ start:43769 stop:45577 length:1809 start_codon:yes stop_codon:yes gene_type:complete